MRCDQTETRLNELLDSRCALETDRELTEHLLACPACALAADAYVAMQRWDRRAQHSTHHQWPGAAAKHSMAPQQLAAHVMREVLPTSGAPVAAASRRAWLPHWATAAAVLIAATTFAFVNRNPGGPAPVQPLVSQSNPDPQISSLGDRQQFATNRSMWHATGHTLATFPLTVLGRNDSSAGMSLDAVRHAIERVRDLLPEEETQHGAPTGETGWSAPLGSVCIA
jgi:hypothetical protein